MSGPWSTCSWEGFHVVISLSAEACCQVPFNSHIYRILLPTDYCSCLVHGENAPLGLAKSLIPALPSQRISKKQWKRKNITSTPSLILSIAQLHYPWGSIGQGTDSMGCTFLCHIPSLGGSISLQDWRLGSRTWGEAGGLGMICLVTGGQYFVLTDGRRHLISEMREITSGTDEEHSIQDSKDWSNAHQQCINSYGST